MLLIIVATVVLNVLGQRNSYPNIYSKRDYEYRDYQSRGPNKETRSKDEILIDQKLATIDPAVFKEIDRILDKYNKGAGAGPIALKSEECKQCLGFDTQYDEFKKVTDQIKEKTRSDPSRTIEDEVSEAFQWAKKIDSPQGKNRAPLWQPWSQAGRDNKMPSIRPSAGMSPYWSQPEQKQPMFPTSGANTPRAFTGRQIMQQALRTLESIDARDNRSPMEKFPEAMKSLPKSLPMDLLNVPINTLPNTEMSTNTPNKLPLTDDYNSPIRWVTLDSNDTSDGLAKVTDPRTGRNQQFILSNTVYVPVVDYNIERLGLTSTTRRPVLTTDKTILRTVQRSVDFNNVDERDWLAFETVLGGANQSRSCDGDSCQSRCKRQACETECQGDTCASGCIGSYCNAFCKGPGCLSMCIGDSCTAKCEGLSCDTRCRGKGCEANCRTFSCTFTINGRYARGGGMWNEHYPQYDYNNIKNSRYS